MSIQQQEKQEQNTDIIIKCKVRLSKQLFPKDKIISNGNFGVISVSVLDVLQGDPQISKWGTITLTGNMCEINEDEIYTVIGKEKQDVKFGLQYQVVFMCTDIKLDKKEDQFKFLEKILTEKQCLEIFKNFDNPIDILEKRDVHSLCTVKGIGVPTAIQMIDKYEANKDYSEAYIKLDKYNLTKNMIDKLIQYYQSPNTVVQKVEENPYLLIDEVDGIGWEKADELALNSGIGEYSLYRTKAYIKYYLNMEANQGNTWVDIDDLLDAIDGIIGYDLPQEIVSESLRELVNEKLLWTNKDKDIVALMRYYILEKNIANEIIRLNESDNSFISEGWEDKVKKLEQKQKWEFTNEQLEGIKTIIENQVVIIRGLAGCVDMDTEYFNGLQWKKISEYTKEEKVLQYNQDGTTDLVNPQKYIKYNADYLWHFEADNIDQCLCDEHIIVYKDNRNLLEKIQVSKFIDIYRHDIEKFEGRFITINPDSNSISSIGTQLETKIKALKITEYKTLDGYKYCFTVDSGMLVLRRNNKIFITGNCGKSSTVSGMLEVFQDDYSFAQTALSGRASCNLTDITGTEGYTIHRLLGYSPEEGFTYNKNNKLKKDIIILDELSMVGADIFYKLIQSIESGHKLIMLGDIGQLEAIGIGNIMLDMIESGYVKSVELTKIHRQAEKSAIITESKKVYEQKQITDRNFEGNEIRGELQDLELDIYKDKDKTHSKIIKHFKKLLAIAESSFDIQVIVPMKDRGKASAYYLNNSLQELVIDTSQQGLVVGEGSKFPFTIFVNDKVINIKNNYRALNIEGEETPIFNGDLGIVKEIDFIKRRILVDFNNKGLIYVSSDHLQHVKLGYAITTHKLQGSSSPYVICGLDYSHYKLLNKEMVYTMLTRAKKYCILCAENTALRFAIGESGTSTKQTFLREFLIRKVEGEVMDDCIEEEEYDEY